MTSTASALRPAAAVVAAMLLAACAQPATAPTVAPDGAPPTASATPSATASATPAPSASADAWGAFESQDGAMRLSLPPGWTVEDRSVVHPEVEMYNAGPGWMNDLVVRDDEGDAMLVYREYFGNDSALCAPPPAADVAVPVEPFAPALRAELDAADAQYGHPPVEVQVRSGLEEDIAWDGERDVPTGEWRASLGMFALIPSSDDCEWDDWAGEIWAGNRVFSLVAVGDRMSEDGMAGPITFGSERDARDWLESDEAATLIDVFESLELTGAPVLEEAP